MQESSDQNEPREAYWLALPVASVAAFLIPAFLLDPSLRSGILIFSFIHLGVAGIVVQTQWKQRPFASRGLLLGLILAVPNPSLGVAYWFMAADQMSRLWIAALLPIVATVAFLELRRATELRKPGIANAWLILAWVALVVIGWGAFIFQAVD